MELDQYISNIPNKEKILNNKNENNDDNRICIVVHEMEGITRFGGISSSYPLLTDLMT